MSGTRKVTNHLIESVYEGQLEWEQLARACLCYLSEDQVADMADCNELLDEGAFEESTPNSTDIEVCQTCYMFFHYPELVEVQPTPEKPLGLISYGQSLDDMYESNTENHTVFSWASCDGCGSKLGGTRYPMRLSELANN